jgi:hypothetical protein
MAARGELAQKGRCGGEKDGDEQGFTSPAQPETLHFMVELLRTNDAVLISFVEALLRDAGLTFFVADNNMSVVEGSLGILPRRVMVAGGDIDAARRLLADAGIADEINGEINGE